MADPSRKPTSIIEKLGLRPLNQKSLLNYYGPIAGGACYTTLAVNLSAPGVIRKVIPHRDVTNVLLLGSIAGLGMYIHSCNHISKASPTMKIVYSLYCSGTLCLSSVLVWAILRSFLPDIASLHAITGIGSSVGLVILGKNYYDFIDRR